MSTTDITNTELEEVKEKDPWENIYANVQQLRIFFNDNYNVSMDMRKVLLDTLVLFVDSPLDKIEPAQGELMALLIELEDRTMDPETEDLMKELKCKLRRSFKNESKFIHGRDNKDLYAKYRDEDGYITDLTLMVAPYQTQRIEHKTGDILYFTEEIYIDSLGRYFRKIYENHNEETEESIAAGILSNFED